MNGRPVFISAEASKSVLRWTEAIACLEAVYSVPHGLMSSPMRTVARGEGGWLRTLTAIPPNSRFMGAKIFGVGPKRMVNYAIVLIEQESGLVAAYVDGATITAFRTAATSALAMNRLARPGPVHLGVLGSGDEARGHVAAIAAIRPIAGLKVFSPNQGRREAFAADFSAELDLRCEAVGSAEEVADGADILIAAARSYGEAPILHGHMLRPHMLAVSIGSTIPEQREADVSAIAACDLIVCDVVEEALNETGDMLAAQGDGIDVASKVVSLNDLVSGKCDERVRASSQPMFKSVGSAIQDIVIAELAFEKAQLTGSAQTLPIDFYVKYA